MSFNVSQKDPSVLRIIKDQLDCGIIKIRKRDGLYSFDVTTPENITKKVIPYFQRYLLLSDSKRNNFAIFCKIAKLMEKGAHKTKEGLYKIMVLRELINEGKGRKRKYGISDVFANKESSETIRQHPD